MTILGVGRNDHNPSKIDSVGCMIRINSPQTKIDRIDKRNLRSFQ